MRSRPCFGLRTTIPFRPLQRNVPQINSIFDSFGWGEGNGEPDWSEWCDTLVLAPSVSSGTVHIPLSLTPNIIAPDVRIAERLCSRDVRRILSKCIVQLKWGPFWSTVFCRWIPSVTANMVGVSAVSVDSAVAPLCVVLAAHVGACSEPNGHPPLFVFKLSNQIELEAAGGRNIITTMITSTEQISIPCGSVLRRQR